MLKYQILLKIVIQLAVTCEQNVDFPSRHWVSRPELPLQIATQIPHEAVI
jgi:hypothetical protein